MYNYSDNATCFDSLGVEYIPKEIYKFIGNKNIITNIWKIQSYNSIISRFFCIGFTVFMVTGESLLHYTNLFSPIEYKKNDKIMLEYFQKPKTTKFFYE